MSTDQATSQKQATVFDPSASAIFVPVAHPDKTCFIAMPFDDEFDYLYHIVNDAASSLGLLANRTDRKKDSFDLIRDIQRFLYLFVT